MKADISLTPQSDTNIVNLEHVLPMKNCNEWPGVTADEIKTLSSRIGNLCLLDSTLNLRLGQKGISEKAPILFKSPILLTRMIGETINKESEWGEKKYQTGKKCWQN